MFELSNEYKNSIMSMFPDIGHNWLDRIPIIIDKYIKEFKLSDVKINDNLTYNVLLFANSDIFGEIVLKIEIPFEEMTIRESRALELNNGLGACKCYYKNIPDGVIILERLMPGNSLTEIKELENRIKVFATVAKKFNIKVAKDCSLPTYGSILQRSIDLVFNNDKYDTIKDLVETAEKMYKEIESKNENDYLLHADLYSDNIIMSNDGYKAIDPHGFVGNKLLDTAIIAQKELDKIGYNYQTINYVLDLLSENCNLDKLEIAKSFYINYVLNICWDREVNIINNQSLENATIIFNYISENTKNIGNSKKLVKVSQ